jgi:GntR family transcriptional repressor for pyruvate dehydrogenase complex
VAQTEHKFQRITTGRSFELVTRELRKAIDRGDLKPGEKLPAEPDLAKQFGVSRSALREALKSLELSGYLIVRRGYGGGTFIAPPPSDDFTTVPAPGVPTLDVTPVQLLEVRLAIEPRAARLAAGHADLEHLLALHAAHKDGQRTGGRPARLLAALADFHVCVARASGNPVFVAVIEGLRPAIYRALNRPVQDATWAAACQREHAGILDMIEARDVERAELAMYRHLHGKEEPGA